MTTANRPDTKHLVSSAFEAVEAKEGQAPRLNKYDPGSLLGYVVYLLESKQEPALNEAAQKVRDVSKDVSKAWQGRENR